MIKNKFSFIKVVFREQTKKKELKWKISPDCGGFFFHMFQFFFWQVFNECRTEAVSHDVDNGIQAIPVETHKAVISLSHKLFLLLYVESVNARWRNCWQNHGAELTAAIL